MLAGAVPLEGFELVSGWHAKVANLPGGVERQHEIPPNSPLVVTVLPATQKVVGEDWIVDAEKALSSAYGQDEPEYTASDVRRR